MNTQANINSLFGSGVKELIKLALIEDAPFGDQSALATISQQQRSQAVVLARESQIFCGAEFLPIICSELCTSISYQIYCVDGSSVSDGTELITLEGSTRSLLQLERPLLNFLQRLCGVASTTREAVEAAAGMTVLDTRKTMPGWRMLDKYAVRVGGGKNHRYSLSDMIMIKNNHIDAHQGDVVATLEAVYKNKPHFIPVEVEVRTLEELKATIAFNPTAVLLDNMSDDQIAVCLKVLKESAPQILIEVSGGITTERLKKLASLGVPAVSMGSLTTVARNRDLSLRIKKVAG
jgi:nicotinate-nucleotide pyrophosphorylase (carboxylating)